MALDDIRDATCVACPAQVLAFGAFDVAPRPGSDIRFDRTHGWRVSLVTGAPTCVHPWRVGLPPATYASTGALPPSAPSPDPESHRRSPPLSGPPPLPSPPPAPSDEDLVLTDDPTLLEAWLLAVLRRAPADALPATLEKAEATAREHFPARQVVAALRRALAG